MVKNDEKNNNPWFVSCLFQLRFDCCVRLTPVLAHTSAPSTSLEYEQPSRSPSIIGVEGGGTLVGRFSPRSFMVVGPAQLGGFSAVSGKAFFIFLLPEFRSDDV